MVEHAACLTAAILLSFDIGCYTGFAVLVVAACMITELSS